jgi:hypothetical protein
VYPAKAAPPFGFSNNELHSCRLSIAEKHGANNRQEQSNVPLTVWYEIHTSAQPIQQTNWRSKSDNRSMGTCKGAFPPHILQKQCHPLALQTMNCTPADYQLQKSMWQTTDRNRARLPSLFGMKFTQVPGKKQYSNRFAEQTMSPNNSVVFHLIMVQRDGEKQSWITSGSHTSIGIDWHPFGVLEADDYRKNNHLQFGNKLIFVNYIYMYKKEFK